MPEQALLRRPVLLVSAGVVTATIIYFAFQAYSHKSRDSAGLHRSNAVRRPRRRWRRGHVPQDLPTDPMLEAIRHLHSRNAGGQPYGRYENHLLFNVSQEDLHQGRYDLSPINIGPLIEDLRSSRPFTDLEKDTLAHHVESIFVQNFLLEEFPLGYIIGEDVESLIHALSGHGIGEAIIRVMVARFDAGKPLTPVNWDLHDESRPANEPSPETHGSDDVTARGAIEALTGPVDEDDSDSGWGDNESDPGGSQGMLDLLYHIAGEQAKRDGLVHREVRCNSCNLVPIRGIRYHCANCFDFDLCETCESQQLHNKSHVFYKIRVPAPLRGHIKQIAPIWYPGNAEAFPNTLPREVSKQLMEANKMEKMELDSLYEQFKCLAGHHMVTDTDPTKLGIAIDRKNFDFYFTTTSDDRPPPQNLIYDRIFAFYDVNNDDLITFDEFVAGLSNLQNRTRAARAKRLFQGYDLDGDGYVSRRDFLRMLRAYYAWHKEINKEIVMNQYQHELEEDIREAIHGTQPISAAFSWNESAGNASRGGRNKFVNVNGDLEIRSGPDAVLQDGSDVRGDRIRAIGDVAVRGQKRLTDYRSFRIEEPADDPLLYLPSRYNTDGLQQGDATEDDLLSTDPSLHIYAWPPHDIPEWVDIRNGLGASVPIEEITDPVDRARVIYRQYERLESQDDYLLAEARDAAVSERWRRRRFYLDEEEGMTRPLGYTEPDSSDDELVSDVDENEKDTFAPHGTLRRQSMRSRSSSKVRFDDNTIDTDHETRSNASSRSVPLNERWGGFELSEAEKDIGREILYQTVQQGFNELLDPLFKRKEEYALEAISTEEKRHKWRSVIDAFQQKLLHQAQQLEKDLGTTSEPTSTDGSPSNTDLEFVPESPDQLCLETMPADQDTTLPHLRPNDASTAALLSATSPEESQRNEPRLRPSDATLNLWIAHDAIDLEAQVRGGYGRLSFREFQQRMMSVSVSSEGQDADIDEAEVWNSTADLGRLSFLGNWLEMARF